MSQSPARLRDSSLPAAGGDERSVSAVSQSTAAAGGLKAQLNSFFNFWTIVPLIGLIGFAYLFLFADSLYDSQAIFNLQNASSVSTSLSSLGSSLLGSSGSPTQSGAVVSYIGSHEMLALLDKKFHLRQLYSSPAHNPFWRLSSDASDQDFLEFYQGMVTVSQDTTTGLITLDVLDFDAQRGHAIAEAILVAAAKFVNDMSSTMRAATIKYAQQQLADATKAVETAQPYQRTIAEAQLSAAQQAMVAAQGLANQQQAFLIRISNPTVPTDYSVPDRLLYEAAILLGASVIYMIFHLLWSNVRDHRKA
jgi:capsule polysaccharide export protein KpsE/RkpR